jgi:hypothetical protein
LALQNARTIYNILFRAAAPTLLETAADPILFGGSIGFLAVLHIVPGGGISLDGSRWVACRPRFRLPVRVLSSRFRRLYLRYGTLLKILCIIGSFEAQRMPNATNCSLSFQDHELSNPVCAKPKFIAAYTATDTSAYCTAIVTPFLLCAAPILSTIGTAGPGVIFVGTTEFT